MSTAISSNKFDILRSDDENERNYEEQAGGGGGVVANAVNHHPRSGSGGPVVVASFDPNQNPLEHRYTFWLSKRKSVLKGKNYDQSMMKLGSFDTVQQFWRYYSFMKRPSKVDEACDLMLFKHGIRPLWEDPSNRDGGRWSIRVKRHNTDRYWENAIMAMIGEQFMVGNEICGMQLSLRYPYDQLSVWHRNSTDKHVVRKIGESLRRILHLPQGGNGPQMDYRAHNDAINKAESKRHGNFERRNTSSDQDSEEKLSS
jgi:translation initiation factor 4E